MFIVASAISVVHCMADVENKYGVLFSHIDFHWLALVKNKHGVLFSHTVYHWVCMLHSHAGCSCSFIGWQLRPSHTHRSMRGHGRWWSEAIHDILYISSRLMNLCWRHNVTESCCGVAQIHSGDYSVRHFGSSRAA
jgi:hypothetical protein